jgi:large subunit ribosomal protein L21
MIAILQINGKQYKVSKGDKVLIDSKIDIENGKVIDLDQVLAISDNEKNIFNPKELESFVVKAKVIDHSRDSKVTIIKKKRRKGYQRKNGHRQDLTMIEIQSIGSSVKKSTAEKKTKTTSSAKATTKKKEN